MGPQNTRTRLRLRDPRDFDILAGRDVGRVFADLEDSGAVLRNAAWHAPFGPDQRDPASYDHLVVAEDKTDGRPQALLGADVLRTAEEEFLFIHTAFVCPAARGRRVLRRMVTTALMQAARTGPVPRVIVIRSLNPAFYRALHRLARDFGVRLYPDLPNGPVDLRAAALARRVAHRISPSCRFESGSGTVRGSFQLHVLAGGIRPASSKDPALDKAFAECLGPNDQFLLLLDLRDLDAWTIMDIARRVRRRK